MDSAKQEKPKKSNKLGEAIRRRRLELGLTQAQLGQLVFERLQDIENFKDGETYQ